MDSHRFFRLALAGLALVAMLAPLGCSDDDDDNPTGGGTPTVNDDLVTVWRATSVTIDGAPVPMADFFEFSEGAVALNLTIGDDATYLVEEVDAANEPWNVLYSETGNVECSGQTLCLIKVSEDGSDLPEPEVVAEGVWAVDGFVLTFTVTEGGSTVVITWSNWLS